MPTARNSLAAATDADGNVYAIGGGDGGNPVATVEKWDGSSWSSIADMPTAKTSLAAASDADGNVYAIGGDDGNAVATVEKYTVTNPPSAPTNLTTEVR